MLQLNIVVRDNYYALCICILTEKIPEDAFYDMGLAKEKVKARDTAEDILKLKKTMTWVEIGAMYGISDTAAYRRAKRLTERKGGGNYS